MLPSELESVRKLVAANGGPFRENPEVYSRICGNSKQYFSVMIRGEGVLIFVYDDSEEFLPVFIHFFPLKNVVHSMWSPRGSFLLCFRRRELVLLPTEPGFEEMTVSVDAWIYDAGFSPQENFLFLLRKPSPNEEHVKLEIRETKTGNVRKMFDTGSTSKESCMVEDIGFLKWDNGDNYIASWETNRVVIIYETKTFSRVRPLIFRQVRSFSWSPSASILAVFADSYIKIVDICSGQMLYKTGWKGVHDYKLFWEGSGDYLACMCTGDDYKRVFLVCLKSGNSKFITPRGNFIDFAWRGNGRDFAVTQGTENGEPTTVKFYTVREDVSNLRQRFETVEGMVAHFLHWSPNGRYMVMQGPLESGELYFYDVDNNQRLTSTSFIAWDLQWDSTSRFFFTQALQKNWFEPVLRVWSSHGVKLVDVGPFDLQMHWRSNLPSAAGSSMDVDLKDDSLSIFDDDNAIGKRLVDMSADWPIEFAKDSDYGH